MINEAATTLPTLHAAVLLADHASPTPALASGALRVLRAALADALTMNLPELIEASQRYTVPDDSQLQLVFLDGDRLAAVQALPRHGLHGQHVQADDYQARQA